MPGLDPRSSVMARSFAFPRLTVFFRDVQAESGGERKHGAEMHPSACCDLHSSLIAGPALSPAGPAVVLWTRKSLLVAQWTERAVGLAQAEPS